MTGFCSGRAHGLPQEPSDGGGWRLLVKDGKSHDPTRVVIDSDGNPPAEGPALREGPGQPRHPEPERGRHGGEIDVPDVVGAIGVDTTSCFEAGQLRLSPRPFPQHAAHGGGAEVQSGPA